MFILLNRVDNIQYSALSGLKDKVAGNRQELIKRFKRADYHSTGYYYYNCNYNYYY